MTKDNKKLFGVILIVVGALFILSRANIFHFNLLFNGWWTLFLMVPAGVSMYRQGVSLGNSVLMIVGVYFFLDENGWNLEGYLLPAILVIAGVLLVLKR